MTTTAAAPNLAEGWYIDGVALDTHARYLETRDGWDDTPGVRGENAELLGRHGQAWRRKKFGPGSKSLAFAVWGVDDDGVVPQEGTEQRVMYEANLDALYRLLLRPNRLLEVLRVYADGSRRVAQCEVTAPITPATTGNTYGQFVIDLAVPGGFFRDADTYTTRLPYDVAGADAQTIEADGLRGQTAPCSDPIITVTGPCSSITVRDSATGSGFTYPSPLAAGAQLVVDAGNFTAKVGTTSVITALTLYDGQLLELDQAPDASRGPYIDVTAPGKASGFGVQLTARRAWLR